MFFTSQYVRGLKDDIRGTMEPQMPTIVQKASTIAKIQQGVLARSKARYARPNNNPRAYIPLAIEGKPAQPQPNLWRDRQLRDYRKANGLCFNCGEKFVPGHLEVCTKRNKPQANALVLNDLDRELTDEVLNELATEDAPHTNSVSSPSMLSLPQTVLVV
jgi:hypothetical protein